MAVQVQFEVVPSEHLVRVKQTFPAAAGRRTFRMAAWVPGSYKIRDFGRHVQNVSASIEGRSKIVEQTGKDAWRVAGSDGKDVTLEFEVYARQLTVQGSHVTNDHAHLFPPNLVMYDEHSRGVSHEVALKLPTGWSAWSGLEGDALDGKLAAADDYDHLIDCPIEAGPPKDYLIETFSVRRKKHRLVVWMPPARVDRERIVGDIKKIVEHTAKLFGGLPYKHYTFIAHTAVDHGGGLEHRNSTVLGIDPLSLVVDEHIKTKLLPLVCHEFFHTWNVKRIKPEAFVPYNLQEEVYTDLLWLFEGFTTYYELPLLKRAGVVDDEAFGKIAAEMLKYYEMALGRKMRSVAECSRLTWSLLYQPHEHNMNRGVSYYTKGLFVGLCLDWYLRTNGVTEGLDVVMRHLWKEFATKGVPEDAMPAIVEAATGVKVPALGRWVNGTSDLPIDRAFKDLGWVVERSHDDPKKSVGLGVIFKPDGNTIDRIPTDSPCFKILQPDDELVAVEGMKWSGKRFAEIANTLTDEDSVRMAVFREGRLWQYDVPLRTMAKATVKLTPRKGAAAATRRRKAWLGS